MISCAGGAGPDWLSQSMQAGLAKSAPHSRSKRHTLPSFVRAGAGDSDGGMGFRPRHSPGWP